MFLNTILSRNLMSTACLSAVVVIVLLGLLPRGGAEESKTPPPKLSAFAPADDLVWQFDRMMADLENAVATPAAYKDQPEGKFARDANMLSLVAIALGVHDKVDAVKPPAANALGTAKHAGNVLAAAKHLAAAKDYAATKAAVNELINSGTVPTGPAVQWSPVVPLDKLMRECVPQTNTALGSDVRKLPKRVQQVRAEATMMAVMAENAKLLSGDVTTTETEKQWMTFCDNMRDAAASVAVKARAGDKTGTAAAMEKLNHSCHECHAVFNPDK